jgi:hypothetical protein
VHCFAELGIADVLAAESTPLSSSKICERLALPGGVKSQPLMYRMLRCLSSSTSKLVEESKELDQFVLTDSGRALQVLLLICVLLQGLYHALLMVSSLNRSLTSRVVHINTHDPYTNDRAMLCAIMCCWS